jgi:cytoskeletal protein CcmA (bactofilin family)
MVRYMFNTNKDKPETQAHSSVNADSGFGSTSRASSSSGKSATLGATIKVKGDISGDENLLIEGQVDGSVNLASHELTVGKTGKVHADLIAKVIRIDGEVHGDIAGKEKVIVSSTSNIKGNIVTPKMTLEEGAALKVPLISTQATPTATPLLHRSKPPAPLINPADRESGGAN